MLHCYRPGSQSYSVWGFCVFNLVDDSSEMEFASSTIIAILLSLVDSYASGLFEVIPWRPNTSSIADFDSVCKCAHWI